MHVIWRFLHRLGHLRAAVTTLPIISGAIYLVKLFWEQQLTEYFQFTLTAVVACAAGWGLGFLSGRLSPKWLERKAAGVHFEVLAAGTMMPFRFRNMQSRGPLGGEMLAHDLILRVNAVRPLKNVRLETIVMDTGNGRKLGQCIDPDFAGDVNRDFSTEIKVATLVTECQRVASDTRGYPPHITMSWPKLEVFGQPIDNAAAFARYEVEVIAYHSSGPDKARLSLEILDCLSAPGAIRIVSGPMDITLEQPSIRGVYL